MYREKFPTLSSVLYWARISAIEVTFIVNQKFTNFNTIVHSHDRLGYHESIMNYRKFKWTSIKQLKGSFKW